MTISDIAEKAGLSRQRLHQLIAAGIVPPPNRKVYGRALARRVVKMLRDRQRDKFHHG